MQLPRWPTCMTASTSYRKLSSVPTFAEILRIKGFLVVSRNQTRDFLDVAALADKIGPENAAATLAGIDEYYTDQRQAGRGVASQLQKQLAEPQPRDSRTVRELSRYRRLEPRWHDWSAVTAVCRDLAVRMLAADTVQEDSQ